VALVHFMRLAVGFVVVRFIYPLFSPRRRRWWR
jgi:hypothetical protein